MAAPVIDPTQSIPDFKQWQSYFWQFAADNDPTAWTATGLPPGIALNTTTGRITGAVTIPGGGSFTLRASNADGVSAPERFYYGIRPGVRPIPAGMVDTIVDLASELVSFTGLDPKVGPTRKRGDDLFLFTRFQRGSNFVDVPVRTMRINLRADGGTAPILTSATWQKLGTGEDSVYLVWLKLDVDNALLEENAEPIAEPAPDAEIADPSATILARSIFADLLGELRITYDRAYTIGPETPQLTTLHFPLRLIRDLGA